MKFGKEFKAQQVPEWQEAYMDYDLLKSHLKEIVYLNQQRQRDPTAATTNNNLKRNMTLYRAFSGLTHKAISPATSDRETHVIIVSNVGRGGTDRYQTMFLCAADQGGELEADYFRKADSELNKVLKFYKQKVEEVMDEALILTKQMEALIALRVKVENPECYRGGSFKESSELVSGIAASRAALYTKTPSVARLGRNAQMDVIDEESAMESGDDDSNDGKQIKAGTMSKRMAPVEVLNHVKFKDQNEQEKFSKRNLKKAELQLKQAFTEFYHKLRLLKSYNFLNIMAFSKIMKKYDKITSRNTSKTYMKEVDDSYLGSSDEVSILMGRVEATFVKHFANSNHRKAMKFLRPIKKREKHRITFSIGFLSGGTVALILALVVLVHARNLLAHEGRALYMETMFPLYTLFGFIVLHMLVFAGNIYFWRRYRINYPFIFGFKEGTELGYKEVTLVGSCLSVLALACVLANLDMEMDLVTRDYKALTELLPLALLVLVIAIMICPFNIMYRTTRFFLLGSLMHCVLAPFYKVSLPDFFLADQLTSQVQAFRSLEFYICYYGWGDFKRRQNSCFESMIFITFYYFVAALPYLWRLLQCLRRLVEEKDSWQGYNGFKYFITLIAVCSRTAYSRLGGLPLLVIAWTTSVMATLISTYWDIVKDWGLFQKNSRNPWLRDKLLVPHKFVYFVAMILNVVLRLAWMQTVMNISISTLHKQTVIAILASLEIFRRGLWNFFRLENEHLNNVGKYRAYKSVPLPFDYNGYKNA